MRLKELDVDTLAQWQVFLRNRGHYKGAIDGNHSAKLSEALAEYQDFHGLSITGEVDAATLDKARGHGFTK